LFVYGTLLPERVAPQLAPLVAGLARIGPGSVPGRLYDLGPYPGAVPEPAAEERIRGHVLAIPDEAVLARLDAYEGDGPVGAASSGFVRETAVAILDDGASLECWIYAYRGDLSGARFVSGGDYWADRDARE
jgi:gamma-glutamylcyclotransferase (GGCT)/AIG2-like uncharacterized protein YtfP